MLFKNDRCRIDFDKCPSKLKEICLLFETLARKCGVEATVTRVKEPVTGESGVHTAGRAVDFRDEFVIDAERSKRLFTDEQAQSIVDTINAGYPRDDRKQVAIHHSFLGGPLHIHIQIPRVWLTGSELKGE